MYDFASSERPFIKSLSSVLLTITTGVLLECGKSAADINDPFLSQAACGAIQVALVDLLASWNIVPARVIGHSSGEIAAAYCAGNLSRKDAWKLAYFRGFLCAKQMNRRGGMAAVGVSPQVILPYLEALREPGKPQEDLVIACYNSSKNITISGDDEKIDLLCAALEKDKIFARKLAVRNAYHSPQMEAVADDYRTLIGELSGTPDGDTPSKEVEMISSVTAQSIKQGEIGQAQYWVENLVLPVRFSDALLVLVSSKEKSDQPKSEGISVQHIVEIGPHSALRSAIRDTLSTKKELATIEYHNLLTRNDSTTTRILSTAATLYCHSYPVGIEAVNPLVAAPLGIRSPQMLTDLPPYEFNHTKSYWKESRLSKNYRLRRFPRHGLFGAPVADWNPSEPKWRGFLRPSELPWIQDHKVRKESANKTFCLWSFMLMRNM
jgi:acyl transferase domain-containing protein